MRHWIRQSIHAIVALEVPKVRQVEIARCHQNALFWIELGVKDLCVVLGNFWVAEEIDSLIVVLLEAVGGYLVPLLDNQGVREMSELCPRYSLVGCFCIFVDHLLIMLTGC